MILSAIAAIGQNNELGANNKLLWNIPGELARFKRITTGHTIMMGRKTFESIGRVLPNRTNIIITHDEKYTVEGAVVVHSLEKALEVEKEYQVSGITYQGKKEDLLNTKYVIPNTNEVFIIGGGQIFAEAMPQIQRLYLTIVHADFPEADVFFPKYSEFTKVLEREDHESEKYKYSFLTLCR